MSCLNDVQIQSIVDGEADAATRRHAETCGRCAGRVLEREKLTASIVHAIDVPADIPPATLHRIERAIAGAPGQGATRLRDGAGLPSWRRAAWSAAAVSLTTVAAIFVVAPMFKGPTTVSASEILARSASRLAENVAGGVELLEYELTMEGVPREMMPDRIDGAYRVRQLIDHDRPGRFAVWSYDASGRLQSSVVQDPAAKRRVVTVRVDGRLFRFGFNLPSTLALSPPELERLHMEATVAMMQASGNQQLQVVDGAAGRQYRIEVPHVSAPSVNAMWDLADARVVVDADDYHVVELAVTGTFLKQPYSLSYRLIDRTLGAATTQGEFDAPEEADAMAFEGEGSAVPVRDVLVLALRELARAPRGR